MSCQGECGSCEGDCKFKNNVLIIGGAGYIGDAILSNYMYRGNDNIIIYDNLMFEDSYRGDGKFIYGDATDYEHLKQVLDEYNPKAVIMLAGIVGDGACATNPEVTQAINVDAVQWLADNYDGRIVFASSCSVYGKADHILSEEMETNPLSLYAETKVKCEEILKNKDAVIFRLGTLYGLSGGPSRPRFDLVGNVLAVKAALGEPITVFSGNQWRPMLHVQDAAEAFCVAAVDKSVPVGIYNLSHKNMNLKNVAEEVAQAARELEIVPDIQYSEMPLEDQRNYRVTNDKFYSLGLINYPTKTIKDSAKNIIQLILSGRIKDPKDALYHNHRWMQENMPSENQGKSSVN